LVVPIFVFAQQIAPPPPPPAPQALPAPGAVPITQIAEVPGLAGLALPTTDPRIIVAKIIRVALGFLGMVALVLILYGGYLWMTSAGNEETIAKAKKVLINATIGLAIILSAFAITQFIINKLLADQGVPPLPSPSAAPPRLGGGALGSGIIESHYPPRGAENVARNTRIIITFKEKIDPESLAELVPEATEGTEIFTQSEDGAYHFPTLDIGGIPVSALRLKREGNDGIPSAIQIIKSTDMNASTVRASDGTKYLGSNASNIDVLVSFTQDLRTFVLAPVERANRTHRALFGDPKDDVLYQVYLCGTFPSRGNCASNGIKLLSTQTSAFQGRFKDYQWPFTTGTFLDVTPPRIQSVIPTPGAENRPRNSMLQVNFNEGVLPTVASGSTTVVSGTRPTAGLSIQPGSYRVMQVFSADTSEFLAGAWRLGNQYRTSEFISADLCGQNSCGEDVFCLPASSRIETRVLAATLAQPGGNDPASAGRFDGIEDIAGNSLDGNSNGTAQGPAAYYDMNIVYAPAVVPPGDNARFAFSTSNTILLGSAIIEQTAPVTTYSDATSGASLVNPIEMTFDRFMAMTTFSSANILLSGTDEITGGFWDSWWTLQGENLQADAAHPHPDGWTLARIVHGGLWEKTAYANEATSRVRDLYQNCYYPAGADGIVSGSATVSCATTVALPYCCNGVAQGAACGF